MARLLLIETATEVCSAAIAVEGKVTALAEDPDQPNHAARLTLLIDQCTRQAGIPLAAIDAVAVSGGPGSYTSLRVGVSVAKGICYALDKPLIAVPTLQALAAASLANLPGSGIQPAAVCLLPMLDARRNEIWTAAYDFHLKETVPAQPLILEHNLFENFLRSVPGATTENVFVVSGNGTKKMEEGLIGKNVVCSAVQKCSAKHFSGLAEHFFQNSDFQDISYFEPFYMKKPNITTPNKPLF